MHLFFFFYLITEEKFEVKQENVREWRSDIYWYLKKLLKIICYSKWPKKLSEGDHYNEKDLFLGFYFSYEETSSVLAAKNLKGHLLIVHGTYDDNVHPQNTFAFINSLIENNIRFEMMIYPWRKHGISDTPALVHLYHLMLDFWKRNLWRK